MEKRAFWHPYSTSGTCFRGSDQIPDVNADHDRITMFTCTILNESNPILDSESSVYMPYFAKWKLLSYFL